MESLTEHFVFPYNLHPCPEPPYSWHESFAVVSEVSRHYGRVDPHLKKPTIEPLRILSSGHRGMALAHPYPKLLAPSRIMDPLQT